MCLCYNSFCFCLFDWGRDTYRQGRGGMEWGIGMIGSGRVGEYIKQYEG